MWKSRLCYLLVLLCTSVFFICYNGYISLYVFVLSLLFPVFEMCIRDSQNTRRFVLSPDNPYYYVGQAAQGIGSPHTPPRYIWHIGLVMQILTSTDEAEKQQCLEMLSRTHAGTNFMHEGFDADDPTKFTRPWFAWANTLFAQMLEKEVGLS